MQEFNYFKSVLPFFLRYLQLRLARGIASLHLRQLPTFQQASLFDSYRTNSSTTNTLVASTVSARVLLKLKPVGAYLALLIIFLFLGLQAPSAAPLLQGLLDLRCQGA